MIPYRDLLFILFAIGEIGIDFRHPHTVSCVKHKGIHVILILIIHHLVSSFLLWGWILPNRKWLLLFVVANALVLMEWFTHRRSYLTSQLNNACGWKPETPFRDLLWWLGLKNKELGGLPLHIILAMLFMVLGIYFYRT